MISIAIRLKKETGAPDYIVSMNSGSCVKQGRHYIKPAASSLQLGYQVNRND